MDGSCLYSTETNKNSSFHTLIVSLSWKSNTRQQMLHDDTRQLSHFWNNQLGTFQTQRHHHLQRLPKKPNKIKKKKNHLRPTITGKRCEWSELKFMVDTNQLWVKLITDLWLETYVEEPASSIFIRLSGTAHCESPEMKQSVKYWLKEYIKAPRP